MNEFRDSAFRAEEVTESNGLHPQAYTRSCTRACTTGLPASATPSSRDEALTLLYRRADALEHLERVGDGEEYVEPWQRMWRAVAEPMATAAETGDTVAFCFWLSAIETAVFVEMLAITREAQEEADRLEAEVMELRGRLPEGVRVTHWVPGGDLG